MKLNCQLMHKDPTKLFSSFTDCVIFSFYPYLVGFGIFHPWPNIWERNKCLILGTNPIISENMPTIHHLQYYQQPKTISGINFFSTSLNFLSPEMLKRADDLFVPCPSFFVKALMLTFLNLPSPLKMRASKTSTGPQRDFTRKKNFRFSSIHIYKEKWHGLHKMWNNIIAFFKWGFKANMKQLHIKAGTTCDGWSDHLCIPALV